MQRPSSTSGKVIGRIDLTQTVELLNPVAPAEFFVSNEGRLATIDNWHNRGYGSVIAIYNPQGNLVKAYALADLFSPAEIGAFPHSVSSAHWHRGPVYINQDQRTLYLMIESGHDLVIGLETGRFAAITSVATAIPNAAGCPTHIQKHRRVRMMRMGVVCWPESSAPPGRGRILAFGSHRVRSEQAGGGRSTGGDIAYAVEHPS